MIYAFVSIFLLAFARLVYLDIKDAKEFNYLKKLKDKSLQEKN
ncbi:hypothetical protein [Psychroflexus salis]|uniref:Uncharacterized protein n=1 Tax=Psychroflexus salis TaxID=1526574 RepID=A0A917ECF0_9FLAO|nr:hypothetical protein [Psychroflexus salis]GGE23240.1 hypothetical protein GCM10010831_25140 [Psychroflexus salis]